MLFLHALLFSLLGTSALAIPVPFGHTSGAVAAGSTAFGVEELLINHELKKKINGLWRSQVPEDPSPTSKMFEISDRKLAKVLSATVPKEEGERERFLSDFFSANSRWVRVPTLKEYQDIMGPNAEATIPEVKKDDEKDELTAEFVERGLIINLGGMKFRIHKVE